MSVPVTLLLAAAHFCPLCPSCPLCLCRISLFFFLLSFPSFYFVAALQKSVRNKCIQVQTTTKTTKTAINNSNAVIPVDCHVVVVVVHFVFFFFFTRCFLFCLSSFCRMGFGRRKKNAHFIGLEYMCSVLLLLSSSYFCCCCPPFIWLNLHKIGLRRTH